MALTLQSGPDSLNITRDPKLGIVAARVRCLAPNVGEALTGPVPDFGLSNLVETQPRVTGRRPEGDQGGFDVEINLEGHLSPADAKDEDYSLETSTEEAVIESHPNISVLLKLYNGKAATATTRAFWPETLKASGSRAGTQLKLSGTVIGNEFLDGGGSGDPKNPMHGVESYFVPKLIWTRRWVSATLPPSIASTVGVIDDPPGNPPEIGQRRNWLKVRARATWRGNIWQIEESWELSGPGGWVPEIYRYEG